MSTFNNIRVIYSADSVDSVASELAASSDEAVSEDSATDEVSEAVLSSDVVLEASDVVLDVSDSVLEVSEVVLVTDEVVPDVVELCLKLPLYITMKLTIRATMKKIKAAIFVILLSFASFDLPEFF